MALATGQRLPTPEHRINYLLRLMVELRAGAVRKADEAHQMHREADYIEREANFLER